MSKCSKITKQDIENMNDEIFLGDMPNDDRELFRRAISEAFDLKIRKIEEAIKDVEVPPPSREHKIRMNRLFREYVGGSFLPFPEENNFHERV